MIITVEKFREYVETDLTDSQIKERLSAVESLIRAYTNNNFQQRNRRSVGNVENESLVVVSPAFFKAGDTIEISESAYNNGLYVISSISDNILNLEESELINEADVLITKIKYPPDVQMGVIEMMKWKLNNELQNSGDKTKAPIASETISRHSVSYATDSTESDIDVQMGVPKKLTAFLNSYMKARF